MMINRSLMWACLLAVVSAGGATIVQAADDVVGWYAGVGAGRADAKRTTSWTQSTDANQLSRGFTSNTLIDSHGTAWKLFGGYQFSENLAVEGGYHDLGRYSGTTTITAPAPASTAGGTWDASALSISAVGILPVVNRFAFFVKGGLAVTRLKVDVGGRAPYSLNETRVQPLLGLGAKFDVTKAFGVRAEFERFNNVGDGDKTGQTPINVFSVSGQYRF